MITSWQRPTWKPPSPTSTPGRVAVPLLVFAICSNFGGAGYLATGLLALVVAIMLARTSFPITMSLVSLVPFALLHAVYLTGPLAVKYLLPASAVVFFFTGIAHRRSGRSLQGILGAGIAGCTVYAIGNLLSTQRAGGTEGRMQVDLWTQQSVSATVQAALWVPAIGALAYLLATRLTAPSLLSWQNTSIRRLTALLIAALAAAFSLTSATRTPLLVIGITCLICLLRFARRQTVVAVGAGMAALGALGWALLGLFGSAALDRIPLLARVAAGEAGPLTQDTRFDRYLLFLQDFGEFADGGLHFRNSNGYVHNILFDEIDTASIWPGIFLLIFLIASITGAVGSQRGRTRPEAMLVFGLGIAMAALFMIEPVLESAPAVFQLWCLLAGITSAGSPTTDPQPEHPASSEVSSTTPRNPAKERF